jgi:N-acetylmuramoyl-L-alanine amidase
MTKTIYFLIIVLLIASCGTNPNKANEKVYNDQLKSLNQTIAAKEATPLKSEPFVVIDSIAYRYNNQLLNYKDTLSKTETKILQNGIVSEWVGTVNFNLRKPNFVILHHTAQDSVQQTLKTFTLKQTNVSAHYVIARDGKVIHMLNDYLRAWHAGNGSWGRDTDINSSSIGIELDNNGFEPFSDIPKCFVPLETFGCKWIWSLARRGIAMSATRIQCRTRSAGNRLQYKKYFGCN